MKLINPPLVPAPAPAVPRWEIQARDDGRLTARLTGSDPPIAVSGGTPASLREQIRDTMLRALL